MLYFVKLCHFSLLVWQNIYSLHLRNVKTNKKWFTYPVGCQDDSSDLLFDRLLEDVRQRRHHVVASQLLAELRAEGQQPNTEDHLVLELEATLVAQHCCDAAMKKLKKEEGNKKKNRPSTNKYGVKLKKKKKAACCLIFQSQRNFHNSTFIDWLFLLLLMLMTTIRQPVVH